MTWIDILWPMLGAASATLALVHLLVWISDRRSFAHLYFAVAAIGISVLAVLELMAMRAQTPAEYGELVRWGHVVYVPTWAALLGFVWHRFRAGWVALALAGLVFRCAGLFANFLAGDNLHLRSVDTLQHVMLGGVPVAIGQGTPNPWIALAWAGNLLMGAWLVHCIVEVRRRGDREEARRALLVCGSIVVFIVLSAVLVAAVAFGALRVPMTPNAVFVLVVIAISHDLGSQVLRAARLVNQLKTSDARLRESEERFRSVVESSPSVLFVVDRQGRIVLANAQAEAVFRYSRDELAQRPVEDLVPRAVREAHAAQRAEYARTPRTRTMGVGCELLGVRSDGSEVSLEIGLNPIRFDGDTFVLATITDIGERLRNEREAALQRDELAHLSRVAMLAELSGSIAHELNQPLAAILSNAQAAQRFMEREQPDLEEVRASLADIVADDKRAGEVIRRLRAMMRKEPSERQVLDLNEVVADVLRLARSDLLARNATVRLELAADLPMVHADGVQLQQVLLNLLINAADAMTGTEPPHDVVVRTLQGAGEVQLSLSDSGCGIPPGELERIFSPFVTSKREGMGLGLAVCQNIVQVHRGRLWAENNPGRGATLHLTLPMAT